MSSSAEWCRCRVKFLPPFALRVRSWFFQHMQNGKSSHRFSRYDKSGASKGRRPCSQ